MKILRGRNGLWLFLLWTVIGLLFFMSYYLDDLARMHSGTALQRFVEEMTGAYTVFILLPAVVYVAKRFPISRATWRGTLAITLLAALGYTVAHTTLMSISRSIIFPLAGMGQYDYGLMLYRYPMEAAKDVIVFAILYACTRVFTRLERGRAAEVAAADLQAKLAEARLQNLRLQLHPHFLFNTLNAISSVMYEDVRKADEMLSKLSDFLRIVLESSGVPYVTLAEELDVERMYVDIMRTRLERQLVLSVSVAHDAGNAEIPFMLLQPLLENSIRHGLRPDCGALDIDIGVQLAQGQLVIDVVDNGTGYPANGRFGYGLRNVQSRLEQTFGAESTFSIQSRPSGGTRVRLSYPYAGGRSA